MTVAISGSLFDRLDRSLDIMLGGDDQDYSEYIDDPVNFCLDVLGDTYISPDCAEMMQAVVDNSVVLGKSGNSVGKSHSAARIALWFFLTRPKSQVFLTAAPPLSNLSTILFGSIFSIVYANPEVFSKFSTKSMHIERSPGSFLTGLSIPSSGTKEQRIAKFSGKHAADGVLFINDEASAIPDEVFSGEETCASDDKSRILSIFNPHARSGWTYRAERDRIAKIVSLSALDHIQVREGRDDITPGAVTRDKTVLRINDWTRALAPDEKRDSSCFEVPEWLEGVTCKNQRNEPLPPLPAGYRKIIEPSFSTVVLGEYPSVSSNSLVDQKDIDAARARWDLYVSANGETAPDYVSATVGFDVAEFGDDLSCLLFNYGGWIPPLITWSGVDPIVSGERCISECDGEKVSRINVDSTGLGAGVAPHITRDASLPAVRVMVASRANKQCELGSFALLNDQLAWEVRVFLQAENAMLPPDEELLEEIAAYTYSVGDDGKLRVCSKSVVKDLLKRSPDRFDALKLSLYKDGVFSGMDLS